ncbi:MAG: radical SAM protein, partial [Firmicutes bacterium]|nr:radical SAM protein [Bacillota bacterium]
MNDAKENILSEKSPVKEDILRMDPAELEALLKGLGEPKFRAKQLFSWMHNKNVFDFDKMSSLPKSLCAKLSSDFRICGIKMLKKEISSYDNTTKYLFEFENDTIIEGVLMKYSYGYAACISTQAGCRMGCTFCASTINGRQRNLTAGEMLEEVYLMSRDCNERIGHIVLMGSGEPLDNYDETLKFIHLINSEKGYNLGQRKITLSTCGLTDK